MIWNEQLIVGQHSCPYVFAVRLVNNKYTNLESFTALKKRKFEIWKWIITTNYSGWKKLGTFVGGVFNPEADINEKSLRYLVGPAMMPAHMFFKSGEDFRNWLGEEQTQKMFADFL